MRPRKLSKGHTASLVAPAFHFNTEHFYTGVEFCEKTLGLKTSFRKDVLIKDLLFAGSEERRISELIDALTSPKIHGIFGIRGGSGCANLYPEVLKVLKKIKNLKPKIFLGYSDLTIFLNGFYQDLGWTTFHGPMVAGRPFREPLALELETMKKCLFTGEALGEISTPEMKVMHDGVAEGKIIGGCLTLLTSTLGTNYEIDTHNKILFIEDIGEAPYRVHRMLTQLRQAGKFRKLRGIIIGEMADCKPHMEAFANVSVHDAIREALKNTRIPVIYDFPAGHGRNQITFPIGVPVQISATAKTKSASVTFLKSGCRE